VLSKHSAWIQSCAIQAPLKRMTEDSVFLGVLPLCYTGGLKASLEVMFPGASLIIRDRFEADAALDAVATFGVTNTYVVPTMFYSLLDAQVARPRDLSTLRWVNCGGAPLSERRLRQAMELFDCHLTQGYGMTEMAGGSVCFAGPQDHIANGIVSPKLTSVGRPLIDCDVKLVGEDGATVPLGEPGEVLVRSDRVMLGYWREAEPSPVDADGYLHTGDIAREDEDGYLFIVDRKKDMIISGGLNIYSKEVEEVLIRHVAVQEAYVVGIPDERWGEAVHAFIVTRPGLSATPEELEQWCRGELGGYKCPRSFAFLDKTDLPINWGGKVQKRSLREAFLRDLTPAI
jgi:acyl-CoA synthetase (AMP-forming)/AMP-acid ligase II